VLFRKLGLLVLFKIKTRRQNKVDKLDCEVKIRNKATMEAMPWRGQAFSDRKRAERGRILSGGGWPRLTKCLVLEMEKHRRRM